MVNYSHYTNIVIFDDKLGVRVRDPETKVGAFYSVKFQPRTFTHTQHESEWRSLDGFAVAETRHANPREYRDYCKRNEDRIIYGQISPVQQFLHEYVPRQCGVPFTSLRTCYMDIEVGSENGFAPPEDPWQEVRSITVRVWGHYTVWGLKDYTVDPSRTDITYIKCATEAELLLSFLQWWIADYPDIVTGWNVGGYDIPYVHNRIARLYENKQIKVSPKILSPWRKIGKRQLTLRGQDQEFIDVEGVATLDYIELYKKHTIASRDNYKLDTIAKVELGVSKVSYEEYGSLSRLENENYQLFIDYNIQDVTIIEQLNNKLHFLDLVCQLAYDARVNYAETFKQVRMWDAMMFYALADRHIVVPPKTSHGKSVQYEGAYVKDPIVGKHKWIVSFDVNSLYPSIMREWNISPDRHIPIETIKKRLEDLELQFGAHEQQPSTFTPIEWRSTCAVADARTAIWALRRLITQVENTNPDKMLQELFEAQTPLFPWLNVLSVCVSPNKQVFRSDEVGFLPEILATLYAERSKFKKMEVEHKKQAEKTDDPEEKKRLKSLADQYNIQQNIRKIGLNSCYGAVGNEHFRFFDTRHAEAVTITGQLIIRLVAAFVNELLAEGENKDYVIYCDTDSVYINLEKIVTRAQPADPVTFIDDYCNITIQPIIDKAFSIIHQQLNTIEPVLAMKRESIAEHGVWTTKKRYLLWVHDVEGARYPKPKLKITGIEAVRSSTPQVCREIIKHALELFMQNKQDEFYSYLETCEDEFYARPFVEVACPRSCNGLDKYTPNADGTFALQTPIHVKGSIVYNRLLEETELTNKYEKIRSGEKIKFCYLKQPNKLNVNVIASPGSLPPEWNLDSSLDKQMQWEKTVLNPLEHIVKFGNWKSKREFSFDSF